MMFAFSNPYCANAGQAFLVASLPSIAPVMRPGLAANCGTTYQGGFESKKRCIRPRLHYWISMEQQRLTIRQIERISKSVVVAERSSISVCLFGHAESAGSQWAHRQQMVLVFRKSGYEHCYSCLVDAAGLPASITEK